MFNQFGVDPGKFLFQVLIVMIPAIWATVRVARSSSGSALAGWLFLIWFVPFIGPVLALLGVRAARSRAV